MAAPEDSDFQHQAIIFIIIRCMFNFVFNCNFMTDEVMSIMKKKITKTNTLTHSCTDRSVGAVEEDALNVIVIGVAPIQDASGMIQGEAIGPQHVGRDKDLPV